MSGFSYQASTEDLLEAFTEAVAGHGGETITAVRSDAFLIATAVLRPAGEVAPGDRFRGGVAIRAEDGRVWVHPYLVRQVCSNGAVMPQTLEAMELGDIGAWGVPGAAGAIRTAVAACADEALFNINLGQFAAIRMTPMDLAISTLPGLGGSVAAGMAVAILRTFFQEEDRSLYGFVNALTAIARETADPRQRWELEATAGALVAARAPAALAQAPAEAGTDAGGIIR